jgi:hypothetical protein
LGEIDINAVDGSIIASRAGGSPAMKGLKPYTCDRKVLRDILLTGMEKVSYGKELSRYELEGSGVRAYFQDGRNTFGVSSLEPTEKALRCGAVPPEPSASRHPTYMHIREDTYHARAVGPIPCPCHAVDDARV